MSAIFIASDHAGFHLKQAIIKNIESEFIDLGATSDQRVDYPDYAHQLAKKIEESIENKSPAFGILICGSGQGMAISANRHAKIRAALCWNENIAKLARSHNDANVLCLSSREVDEATNFRVIKAFLETAFEGGRHTQRIQKI